MPADAGAPEGAQTPLDPPAPHLGGVEIELSFRLQPERLDAAMAHPALRGDERRQDLRAVYFDTPDQDLRRGGFGLRLRRADDVFVQTLKRQEGPGDFARGEWETPVRREALDLDALGRTPLASAAAGRLDRLVPVFATTVERRTRLLQRDGALIEAAFDRGEVAAGGRRTPVCELELELKAGAPDALFELGRTLAAEFGATLSLESKAERGYRLVDHHEISPLRAEEPRLSPELASAEAFKRIARACLAQVCGNAGLLTAYRRPEAVHQMRVGLRRLRAAITAFQPLLVDPRREPLQDELKWLARELDPARDLDVFIRSAFMPAAEETHDPTLAALGRRLHQVRGRAYDAAVSAVTSHRYALLLVETARWIELGDWTRGADPVLAGRRARPIGAYAPEAMDRMRRTVRRLGRGFATLDADGRHKLRIRVKRLRYAAEFFAGVVGGRDKAQTRFLEAAKRLQEELGEANDIVVAASDLLVGAGLDTPELAFAAGRLVGRRERHARKLIKSAAKALADFDAAEPFWRTRG